MDKLIDWYGFSTAVVIKNLIIFGGGLLLGIVVCFFIIGWISKVAVRDSELDCVKIMRVQRKGKTRYIGNPRGPFDAVHGLFIMLAWELGIIRKNSVYYENANISRVFMCVLVILAFFLIIASLYLSFTILDLTRAKHPVLIFEFIRG